MSAQKKIQSRLIYDLVCAPITYIFLCSFQVDQLNVFGVVGKYKDIDILFLSNV